MLARSFYFWGDGEDARGWERMQEDGRGLRDEGRGLREDWREDAIGFIGAIDIIDSIGGLDMILLLVGGFEG